MHFTYGRKHIINYNKHIVVKIFHPHLNRKDCTKLFLMCMSKVDCMFLRVLRLEFIRKSALGRETCRVVLIGR